MFSRPLSQPDATSRNAQSRPRILPLVKGDDFPTSSRRRTDLSRLTIGTDARIQDGITAIDAGRAQIALVVDHQGRLVGTLTDGDIRRGLLRNMTLEDSVAKVMQCDFGSVDRGTSDHEALR